MSLNNYRITFKFPDTLCEETDPQKMLDRFHECWWDFPKIKVFLDKAREWGINEVWYFFEPYVELNWLSDDPQASEALFKWFDTHYAPYFGVTKMQELRPKDGLFADWYCNTEREREFGAKRHAICCRFAELMYEYQDCISQQGGGKGWLAQVRRTFHTICNPLGINHKYEFKMCLDRGLLCWLYQWLPYKKAHWVYKYIFRRK